MTLASSPFRTTILGLLLAAAGCAGDEVTAPSQTAPSPTDPIPTDLAFQELYDQGFDRYLGVFTPSFTEMASPGVTRHVFAGLDGPICFTGNEFSMFTRDGSGNDLLIFLQGGGFCGPEGRDAVEAGIPLLPFGILNPTDPLNPAGRHDVGYVPYCDGCAMMGDAEVDSDGDGVEDRFFRGLQNLSASLDVIADRYPAPERIVLAGNSAGGFAVHSALPLVRKLYPDVPIDVINDSGLGIANPGRFETLFDYWGAESALPSSCADCLASDGNLTGYHAWQLEQDENVRMAYVTSKQDSTFAAGIIGGGPGYELQVLDATAELNARFPERFQSLVANGDEHTFILRRFDYGVAGTTVREWVGEMLAGDGSWASRVDPGA